jgi:hypothetical protein
VRRLLLPLLSLTIFLGSGELMLRMLYRDAGRRTLAGPGGGSFEHLSNRGDERGRFDVGPRRAGVPRIMVMGDSVTYGQGVREWRDVWPEILATTYERAGTAVEMAVFAAPGRGVPEHVEQLRHWGPKVQPDILVYQWYVNDIEVISHRPEVVTSWQRWGSHRFLRDRSYLYFFFDRFAAARAQAGPYLDYILHDFAPGTTEWAEFERQFHAFATLAQAFAGKRVMVLYPQVPYGDQYPLKPIHDRMREMATAHTLSIPPTAWVRQAGSLTSDPSAPAKQILAVQAGVTGTVADTNDFFFMPGQIEMAISYSTAASESRAPVGTFALVDALSSEVLATAAVFAGAGSMQTVPLRVVLTGDGPRRIRARIASTGTAQWQVGAVSIPVDYGIRVVDLAEPLNSFNTHASVFDAHPNEAAHRVIAEHVYRALNDGK